MILYDGVSWILRNPGAVLAAGLYRSYTEDWLKQNQPTDAARFREYQCDPTPRPDHEDDIGRSKS